MSDTKMPLIVGPFRCIDKTGCEAKWSPTQTEVDEVEDARGLDAHGLTKRGFAKVALKDSQQKVGRARKRILFDAAQKVLQQAMHRCNSALTAVSTRIGSGLAVPQRHYAAFEQLRLDAQAWVVEANGHADVVAANEELRKIGRQGMSVAWYPGLHAEFRLADPEDEVRAKRLQQSVAESIAQVLAAVRSQDRDRIRLALDSVGALADAVADPQLRGDVQKVFDLAQGTLKEMAEANRQSAAADRAKAPSKREEARRREREARAALLDIGQQAQEVTESLSRFELLDTEIQGVLNEERRHQLWVERQQIQEAEEAQPQRLQLVDVGDKLALSEEEAVAFAAAQAELAAQPDQDQRLSLVEID